MSLVLDDQFLDIVAQLQEELKPVIIWMTPMYWEAMVLPTALCEIKGSMASGRWEHPPHMVLIDRVKVELDELEKIFSVNPPVRLFPSDSLTISCFLGRLTPGA